MSKETIDHPGHYGGENNPFETIKVIEAMGWGKEFCYGNAMKYLSRAGRKPGSTEAEDLKKVMWYINRRLEQIEGEP